MVTFAVIALCFGMKKFLEKIAQSMASCIGLSKNLYQGSSFF
jgi:hypothetical protein